MTPGLTEQRERKSPAECDPALICGHCVYVLRHAETGECYYGYTEQLSRRLIEHQRHGPWRLVYYEAYASAESARLRERTLKHYGQARTHLKRRAGIV